MAPPLPEKMFFENKIKSPDIDYSIFGWAFRFPGGSAKIPVLSLSPVIVSQEIYEMITIVLILDLCLQVDDCPSLACKCRKIQAIAANFTPTLLMLLITILTYTSLKFPRACLT
jgi:hypothetical protein